MTKGMVIRFTNFCRLVDIRDCSRRCCCNSADYTLAGNTWAVQAHDTLTVLGEQSSVANTSSVPVEQVVHI